MDFDIIVIGAGLGGLTAAACATKEKKRVLVLEQRNTPGGFATSFKRGRFEFEASLHELCGYSKSQGVGDVRIILDELGLTNKIAFSEPKNAYRIITTSKNGEKIDATMPFGIENYINSLEEYVPGSRASVEKLFSIAENTVGGTNYLAAADEKITVGFAKNMLKEFSPFVHTASYSVNEVLKSLEMPQKAIDIITGYWCYLGVDCDRLSFTHFILMLYSYIAFGAYVPEDRSHDISMSLAGFIEDNGSEIRYNTQVSRIIVENNQAKGVILKNGEKLFCNHIIGNISPTTVYSKMMKSAEVPVTAIKRTNARTFGARGACVYLGLNRSKEELSITDYNTIITETSDSSVQYDLMRTIGSNNVCIATCLNNANPRASSSGTTILTLTTLFTENCWANIEPENYFNEKNNLAKRLIKNYEDATGIKISNYIEEIEIATPLTFARFTGSPQGVIFGYLGDNWDSLLPRFMTEKSDNDTKGLRFCGGWGTQLSGVSASMASGRNSAYATIDDINSDSKEAVK